MCLLPPYKLKIKCLHNLTFRVSFEANSAFVRSKFHLDAPPYINLYYFVTAIFRSLKWTLDD